MAACSPPRSHTIPAISTRPLPIYERLRVPRSQAAVLGSRARAHENHLASPWARLKRDVKFALRTRFGGGDKTAFQVGWLYSYDVAQELR